ncbi:hypothetical protein EY693_00350 [Enterococcus casseliflavus]|uniref:hypothetical protein n=1 Tax=Enterococcus casseliflavus TaxID=37734 RepID=UPI001AD60652|nr:hypothetical protein [Enterococcus casseliflavus]MBO6357995.1 hypothetical protein [Enterococcus casseliflavus]MBO6374797.1 hypothetical protein [Enterococcus casseliflavus]
MKKVILGTTLATSLLLVGGITASADVAMPEVSSIPFAVTITEGASRFAFNDMKLNETFQISPALFANGTMTGTIENVGGTLTNLTRSVNRVTITVSSNSEGIVITENHDVPVVAEAISESVATSVDTTFTFNRQTALLDEGAPTITVTASDTTDSGNGQQL